MILALTFLILGIGCYSISQLQQHGKLKWMNHAEPFSFWEKDSHVRKYKELSRPKGEAFLFSTTFLVFLTDGYHFMQFMFFNFLSLSVTFALNFSWWLLLGVWSLIHLTHFATYKFLSK